MKALTIKNIPEDVLLKFKAWAALQDMSMSDAIVQFMKEMGDRITEKK